MEQDGGGTRRLVIDAAAAPEVFVRVVEAKRYLETGEARTAAEAARLAGLSRSAFYKYRDAVFLYDEGMNGRILTVHFLLRDRPGVLSAVLSAFAAAGANILTVNQNIPDSGAAAVSISARADRMNISAEEFARRLRLIDGVRRVGRIAGADGTSEKMGTTTSPADFAG
ncbi:MAG: ACT domain-containing protein [Clostridiales bacterium]|nr:ACT domain-containing protein [Clostridiales bacterium]